MRVLVCGGRDFWDPRMAYRVLDDLDRLHGPITVVIQGEARGADALSKIWAGAKRPVVEVSGYAADWVRWGNAAGPIRNDRMIKEGRPDYVVAFPGGIGTADMVAKARAAGLDVFEVTKAGDVHRLSGQG